MTKYYKVVKEHLDFDTAFDIVKNQEINDASMRVKDLKGYSYHVIGKNDLPSKIEEITLPVGLLRSLEWEIVVPDYEMEEKLDELRYWLQYEVDKFELDTRFFDIYKMSIADLWNRIDEQIVIHDEKLAYDIMMWLKETGRLNK
jgi:hypothetical protein